MTDSETKPQLICHEVSYYQVDYNEVEKLLHELFEVDYEVGPDMESSNGSKYDIQVDAEPVTSDYDKKEQAGIHRWLTEGADQPRNYILYDLMKYLCVRGHIKPARYLIEVDW